MTNSYPRPAEARTSPEGVLVSRHGILIAGDITEIQGSIHPVAVYPVRSEIQEDDVVISSSRYYLVALVQQHFTQHTRVIYRLQGGLVDIS